MSIKKGILRKFELAPEAAGCVRLVAIDNTNVCIENHGKITEYTCKRVKFDAGELFIVIEGEGLVLGSFGAENAAITGGIASIRFENNPKRGSLP